MENKLSLAFLCFGMGCGGGRGEGVKLFQWRVTRLWRSCCNEAQVSGSADIVCVLALQEQHPALKTSAPPRVTMEVHSNFPGCCSRFDLPWRGTNRALLPLLATIQTRYFKDVLALLVNSVSNVGTFKQKKLSLNFFLSKTLWASQIC